ncbi:TEA/ATTS domain family-domain-containing protein [Lineolata rhizophorae]|uniref:TEA/ATTS domain family-domain-containing protein n=1 Tax=Lineolata rhizophorae TaxID=578093 RepID=A0A6A6NQ40_9PEZI|nr:TEA/ATTS domain family-domain-containing protein [Lineolata rhizophorae]
MSSMISQGNGDSGDQDDSEYSGSAGHSVRKFSLPSPVENMYAPVPLLPSTMSVSSGAMPYMAGPVAESNSHLGNPYQHTRTHPYLSQQHVHALAPPVLACRERTETEIESETRMLLRRVNNAESYRKYRDRQPKDPASGATADAKAAIQGQTWPDHLEETFFRALVKYPPMGRTKMNHNGRPRGRNELIAEYIERCTGEPRSRKQISSHIQVLKPYFKHDPKIMYHLSMDEDGRSGRRRHFGPSPRALHHRHTQHPDIIARYSGRARGPTQSQSLPYIFGSSESASTAQDGDFPSLYNGIIGQNPATPAASPIPGTSNAYRFQAPSLEPSVFEMYVQAEDPNSPVIHTFSKFFSKPQLPPLHLFQPTEELRSWQEQFPALPTSSTRCSSDQGDAAGEPKVEFSGAFGDGMQQQPTPEYVLAETSLDLDVGPIAQGLRLAIWFALRSTRDLRAYRGFECRTRFFDAVRCIWDSLTESPGAGAHNPVAPGKKASRGAPSSKVTYSPNDPSYLQLPFESRFWAKTLQELLLKLRNSGTGPKGAENVTMPEEKSEGLVLNDDPRQGPNNHDRGGAESHQRSNVQDVVREYISRLTATQELYAYPHGSGTKPIPLLVIAWRFKQAGLGEQPMTTWRSLVTQNLKEDASGSQNGASAAAALNGMMDRSKSFDGGQVEANGLSRGLPMEPSSQYFRSGAKDELVGMGMDLNASGFDGVICDGFGMDVDVNIDLGLDQHHHLPTPAHSFHAQHNFDMDHLTGLGASNLPDNIQVHAGGLANQPHFVNNPPFDPEIVGTSGSVSTEDLPHEFHSGVENGKRINSKSGHIHICMENGSFNTDYARHAVPGADKVHLHHPEPQPQSQPQPLSLPNIHPDLRHHDGAAASESHDNHSGAQPPNEHISMLPMPKDDDERSHFSVDHLTQYQRPWPSYHNSWNHQVNPQDNRDGANMPVGDIGHDADGYMCARDENVEPLDFLRGAFSIATPLSPIVVWSNETGVGKRSVAS